MNRSKSWEEVAGRIRSMDFKESFDLIVAIANGGIIPAALLNQRLQLPIELLKLSYRNERQQPLWDAPRLVGHIDFDVKGKKVLLVEDRVKTGATLAYAKELMKEAAVLKTFAVNGQADYALWDEACFSFPWIL
jgi:hypoxanthine phosphoribosyltransferase